MKYKINLSQPVKSHGVEIDHLVMRESTVLDELAISKSSKSPAESEIATFANLCEVEPSVIQSLTSRDHARLVAAYRKLNSEKDPEEHISPLD